MYTWLPDYQVIWASYVDIDAATKCNVFWAKMTLTNRSSYIILIINNDDVKQTRIEVRQAWAAPGAPPWNGQ